MYRKKGRKRSRSRAPIILRDGCCGCTSGAKCPSKVCGTVAAPPRPALGSVRQPGEQSLLGNVVHNLTLSVPLPVAQRS